jgi:hypothetical protein
MSLVLTLYEQQLIELSQLLDAIGEKRLSCRLARWASELNYITLVAAPSFKKHVARTNRALSRMKATDDLAAPPSRRPASCLDTKGLSSDKKLGHMLRDLRFIVAALNGCGFAAN